MIRRSWTCTWRIAQHARKDCSQDSSQMVVAERPGGVVDIPITGEGLQQRPRENNPQTLRARLVDTLALQTRFPLLTSLFLLPTLMSYKPSDLMSAAQDVPRRKRKRVSADAYEADNTPHILSKQQRVNEHTREARHAARDRFWDTLSKVWLTPRALREFDRRNAVQDRKQTYTADLGFWPRKRLPIDISLLTAASLKILKRFARRGGPSLTDLRIIS